jgi:hypothetical protein
MPDSEENQTCRPYQITIRGHLDEEWASCFNLMKISYKEITDITILTGPIADQAELRGIINKLWDLNKSIIAVSQLTDRI